MSVCQIAQVAVLVADEDLLTGLQDAQVVRGGFGLVALPGTLVGRQEGTGVGAVISPFGMGHTTPILAGQGSGFSEAAYKETIVEPGNTR